MRSAMHVRFWGVRGSIPSPGPQTAAVGGNTACVEVAASGREGVLVIDAGSGLRALGLELSRRRPAPPLIRIVLSHFHWDHLQGLPFFQPLFTAGSEIEILASCDPAVLREVLGRQMTSPFFPVAWPDLPATIRLRQLPQAGVELDSIRIVPFRLRHPQGCSGFRLEADGAALVYASDFEFGDAAHDDVLVQHARKADVLICDAQHTPEEQILRAGWGHSSWQDAVEVAGAASVGQLVLFHHDPAHTDADLERVLTHSRLRYPYTRLATEGAVLPV